MPIIETDRTDVGSYLGLVADRLRADAMALTGYGETYSSDGSQQLHGIAASLENVAKLLEGLGEALCRNCKLREVVEQVRLEVPAAKGKATGRAS